MNKCKRDLSVHNMCRRPQPGYYSNYPPLKATEYNCKTIMERTMKDSPAIRKVERKEPCKSEEYKGAVVVAPGYDYHYYRHNDDKSWTHKPGYKHSTNLDASGNIITDPLNANRKYNDRLNYSDFCDYVCVPRNPKKKKMSYKFQGKR